MKKIALLAASSLATLAVPVAAGTPDFGWPDTIDLLMQLRLRAETCTALLKSTGNLSVISEGRTTYEAAKDADDTGIAGLIITLVEGGRPENLQLVSTSFKTVGAQLQNICDVAVSVTQTEPGRKMVIVQMPIDRVTNALTSGIPGLWQRRTERDSLESETIRAQLEEAKWPYFEVIR